MRRSSSDLLTGLLRDVSRSFYLTLRVLPPAIRPQIGLAYLLARAADTIADTEIVPVAQRLEALDRFRERVLGRPTELFFLTDLAEHPASTAERVLMARIKDALAFLEEMHPEDQQMIREVLTTITSGQQLDLQRFAYASSACIVPLKTEEELEDYTFRVAGCVGEFWTKMCRAHLRAMANSDATQLVRDGIRFGQGLQLVNILRDVPGDLRRGRCYLPLGRLTELGLSPSDLSHPETEPRLRPLYEEYLDRAEASLEQGWAYTNALPAGMARVRLACSWPILIGLRTLAKLQQAQVLATDRPLKISRTEVRRLMLRSVLLYPFPTLWQRLFESTRSVPQNRLRDRSTSSK